MIKESKRARNKSKRQAKRIVKALNKNKKSRAAMQALGR